MDTKTKQKKIKNVPKLRFPEFGGVWEEKRLGDVCKINTGNKDTQDKVKDGKYPFFVRSNTVERINSFSFNGEAILTSGDGVGVGKNFHYINGKFDYHQRVYCLNSFNEKYSGKFIYDIFSEQFNRRVMRLSAKNSVDSVRMDMIVGMPIFFPTLSEQKKLSSFLGEADKWIGNLKEQKKELVKYKKEIMQKIFSQEIRFRNKEGKSFPYWEEKRLGDIFEINVGGDVRKISFSKTKHGDYIYPVYANALRNKGLYGYSNRSKIKKDSVTVTARGDIGYAVARTKEYTPVVRLLSLISKSNDVPYFFECAINNMKIFVESTGVPQLTAPQLSFYKIKFPSILEQQKISDFLSSLDVLLQSKQSQISEAENWKKGLIKKMFV